MKTNSSFPHPVLGVNSGILPDLDDNALEIVDITEQEDIYRYAFQLNQHDDLITSYIKRGFAEYICEVDCSKTFYKQTCHSESPEIVVSVKKKDVIDHIDFSFFVVTKKYVIPKYQNPNFNPDYKDPETEKLPQFYLETGSVLVLFPQYSDNVSIRFNNRPELNAFIQVVKRNDTEEDVNIDLSDDIINIELPQEMYETFRDYNRDQYRGIFYTSLVFNALIKGILNIEEYEGTTWADSIKAIIELMPDKFNGLELDKPADAVEIATKMMSHPEYGTPYDLLFQSIKEIQD